MKARENTWVVPRPYVHGSGRVGSNTFLVERIVQEDDSCIFEDTEYSKFESTQ